MLAQDRYDYQATASRILGDSLKPLPGMSKVNLTLDRFASNLDKLLRIDKLSDPKAGGVSCYQALFGVYASLKKLFDHEKKMALSLMDANTPLAAYKAEREVLCKKSGRPRINAGDCLGLSLEYWMDRRHIFANGTQRAATPKGKGKDVTDDYPEDKHAESHEIYSLTIECESSPSSLYSPIRISDNWISDDIEKAPSAADTAIDNINNLLLNRPTLDWQEPPPTYLQSAAPGDHDAMNLDNAPGRLPNIRFVAKFNPPVVVPLSVFVNIQQALGLDVPSDIRPTTFVGLALRPSETDPGMTALSHESTPEIRVEKPILVISKDGAESQIKHSNALYVPRTEYSRTIESLPFSHPRQLVEILPTLRQYAFTTSLLKHSFGTTSQHQEEKAMRDPLSPPPTPDLHPQDETPVVHLDISLSYAPPAPRLRFDIPHPDPQSIPSLPCTNSNGNENKNANGNGNRNEHDFLAALVSETEPCPAPIRVTLDVHPNAEIIIDEQNVIDISSSGGDKGKDGGMDTDIDIGSRNQNDERVKRIARALDVCVDVGVWGEWVRREVGGGEGS